MKDDTYTVYGLVDPTNGLIRYVGMSNNIAGCMKWHYYEMNTGDGRPVYSWLRELQKNSLAPNIIVFKRFEGDSKTKDEAMEFKGFLIDTLPDVLNIMNRNKSSHNNNPAWAGWDYGYKAHLRDRLMNIPVHKRD